MTSNLLKLFLPFSRILSWFCFIYYPSKQKYPTPKSGFFFRRPLILLLFTALILFSSCKTCQCPAYSILEPEFPVPISSPSPDQTFTVLETPKV